MSTLINRNTTIPCKNSGIYYTVKDYQESVCIKVFQWEREFTKDNHFLGKFTISNIRKDLAGKVEFEETFELDINNILKVTAREIGNDKNTKELTIRCDNDRLSEEEIQRLVKEAEIMKKDDLERIKRVNARLELETFLIQIGKKNYNEVKNNKLKEKIKNIQKWCKEYNDEKEDVYFKKIEEMKNFIKELE